MSLLSAVSNGISKLPRRIMLYGVQGIGKSTFAASAPNPIFIPTEDGLGDINCNAFPLCKSYQSVLDALGALYAEEHEYKTVAIDSLDWLERLIWAEVCAKHGIASIDKLGFGKGYNFAIEYWRVILSCLQALRVDKGMTIVLLAHSKVERFEDPESAGYDRYVPRLHKHAAALIQEWCDEVLFATYKVFVRGGEDGSVGKAIGTGERVIRTVERPSHVAKNRLKLPEELTLAWASYAQHLKG